MTRRREFLKGMAAGTLGLCLPEVTKAKKQTGRPNILWPFPNSSQIIVPHWTFMRHTETKGGLHPKLNVLSGSYTLGPQAICLPTHSTLYSVKQVSR